MLILINYKLKNPLYIEAKIFIKTKKVIGDEIIKYPMDKINTPNPRFCFTDTKINILKKLPIIDRNKHRKNNP